MFTRAFDTKVFMFCICVYAYICVCARVGVNPACFFWYVCWSYMSVVSANVEVKLCGRNCVFSVTFLLPAHACFWLIFRYCCTAG